MKKLRNLLRRYWELVRGHRKTFLWGAGALLLVDLLDLLPPKVLSIMIDTAGRGSQEANPLFLAGAYVGIFIIQNALRLPMRLGFMGTSLRIAGGLRERYAHHLLRLPGRAMEGHQTGDLISRATNDLETVERGLGLGMLFLFDSILYLLLIPPILLGMNPILTLYAIIPIPLLALLSHVFIRWIGQATDESFRAVGRMTAACLENGAASETVQAFGMEDTEVRRFEESAGDSMEKNLALARTEAGFSAGLQVLVALATFGLLVLGGRKVLSSELSTGQLVAFLQYIGMLAWPLSGLSWAFILLRKGGSSFERIDEILGIPPASEGREGRSLRRSRAEISICGLTYQRPGSAFPTLRDVSFHIRPGERVALVGAVGSGKSTLFDLLTRYLDPPPGMIFIDGEDVLTLSLDDLHRRIAVAEHVPFLFTESIRENIERGIVPGTSKDGLVETAVQAARVTQDHFPEGLDTQILGKGSSLSGGQRQRVALARALAREAPILILDDATSALDLETEEAVYDALWRTAPKPTILFATHRLNRLRKADRILIFAEGRLKEEGSHQELTARGGIYASLVRRQPLEESFDQA